MHFKSPKSDFGRNLRLISGRHLQGIQAIKYVGLYQKTSLSGCRKRILRVKMILLEKNIFRNFHLLLYFWTISKIFLRLLAELLLAGLTKLRSTVSEIFEGQKLSHQKKFFPPVPDFELMIYGIESRNFGKSSKLRSTCPQEHSA